ncbi:secA translation cis-regulator SecM [Pectobacteriaceae bacterium CE90]|nr:secA translation cis-regulator SecM [Prodigiosinella sp. LS101]WJV53294.1 secA translation cis-regulator SecM [Prodigiosinella sp. LS101]WJV57655.1 secA translation cis-regulator SecM [Pectobacteriaceae bacterium C111]WJY15698.1 secA translation cis-regulator SecM [Pectobacteriaceae bacterium CE90]
MIGILNRWRQFGRRYFWPHLLLGMVAASLGLPNSLGESQNPSSLSNSSSAISRQNSVSFDFTDLVALKDSHRRSSFSVDYWHRHAIRTVIRHLSFALTIPQSSNFVPSESASTVHHQVLLETLNALLTHEVKPLTLSVAAEYHFPLPSVIHQPGLWLAQTQGIRAGPCA